MSAYSQRLLAQEGKEALDLLKRYENYRLIEIPGDLLSSNGQSVYQISGDDPEDECRDAHVEIIGHKGKSLQKKLRRIPFFDIGTA